MSTHLYIRLYCSSAPPHVGLTAVAKMTIITKPSSQVSIVSETLLYIWFSSWKVPWLMRCARFPANATRVLNWDTWAKLEPLRLLMSKQARQWRSKCQKLTCPTADSACAAANNSAGNR